MASSDLGSAVQRCSRPGSPALQALAELVAAAKQGEPMAPVTVVVPTRRSALALRREVAAASPTGLVNVRFEVAGLVAELLGQPVLAAAGRRPASGAVLNEAIRGALVADRSESFGSGPPHPATIERVASSYRELRAAASEAREAIRRTRRGAALARLCDAVEARLTDWYDPVDLAGAAAGALDRSDPAARELGRLVFFAPDLADPIVAPLLASAGASAAVLTLEVPAADDSELHAGLSIISVSDPDEEAHAAVREVAALLAEGVPLHRIAIAHADRRYGAALHQHLERAGLPHHGAAVRRLSQTVAGITLTGLLGLAADGLPRDGVIDWLASAPILDPGKGELAPVAMWDIESRRAGVLGGAAQWSERLARRAAELSAATDLADDDDLHAARDAARVEAIGRLARFITELAEVVDDAEPKPWSAWSRWALGALTTYLGNALWRERWPDAEIDAFDQVTGLVDGLSLLDGLAPAPDLATFTVALTNELEVPAGRLGRFGDGVYVGPIRSMIGLSYDAIVVVGGAEGMLPHRPPTDPLLGELEREAAGLPAPDGAVADQRREIFLTLGAASARRVVLVPRGDLRSDRAYVPSRWVVELSEAAGIDAITVRSFADGLASSVGEVSPSERALRALWSVDGGPLAVEASAPAHADGRLAAALLAQRARLSEGFTEYDGRTDPDTAPDPHQQIHSPTSLQLYARCPRRYFFSKVLGLGVTERPEEVTQIQAMTRGSLVHAILERWVADRIAAVPGADELDHLLALAEEAFTEIEERGLAGRPLAWSFDRSVIRRDLVQLALRDVGDPLAVELSFGGLDQPPVTVELPDGTTMAFRGSIDRVDRAPDGSLLVTDYKTGGTYDYRRLDETTVERGELLQLPVYALAAQARFGADAPVRANYWFISEAAAYERIGYEVDGRRLGVLSDTLGVIVDGIRSGRFPARPGAFNTWKNNGENCLWCQYNAICPTDRLQQWERSAVAPELATYVELTRGPAPVEADA